MLGLIVIVLISLAAFTRVETNVASSGQYEAQARQNAMTALNLAIGQLQRAAGPDKRVTATGGLVGANNSQNPYWTGVWDSSPGAASNSRGFQSWLVNPANGNLSSAALATASKSTLTVTTNGTNSAGDDGVVRLVGDGEAGSGFDGSVVASPGLGEPGNGGPADAQFINLRLDKLTTSGLPGFGNNDYRTYGRIAWWTSDDGVKASLSGINRVSDINYGDGASGGDDYSGGGPNVAGYVKRERLNAMTLQAPRIDLALRNYVAPTDPLVVSLNADIFGAMLHPASRQYVSRVDSTRQYTGAIRAVGNTNASFTNPSLNPSTTRNNYVQMDRRLRERFHDVAPATFSVLSNVAAGGLKTDFDVFTPSALPSNQQEIGRFKTARVRQDANTDIGLLQSRIEVADLLAPPSTLFSLPPGTPGPLNEPVVVVGPIMTECQLNLRLNQTATGGVSVSFEGNVELWNPYNATLFNPNSANDRWVLRVLIRDISGEKFSDVRLTDAVNLGGGNLNIARTLGVTGPQSFEFKLDLISNPNLAPGQAKTWPLVAVAVPAKDDGGTDLAGFDTTSASVIATEVLGNSRMVVSLVRLQDEGTPSEDKTVFYNVVDVDFVGSSGSAATGGVGYYFRLNDANDYSGATDWLEDYDPRGPRIVAGSTAAVKIMGSDPNQAYTSYNGLFDSEGELIKSTGGSTVIADLPRQQITSVGYLQQMPHTSSSLTTNSPAFRIGSANGSAFNSLFDSHFFSTVPRGATTWNPSAPSPLALPNTSLIVVSRQSGPPALANLQGANLDTARYFLARDTLNVNSVSLTAWRSVLGGVLPGFTLAWDGSGTDLEKKLQGSWRYTNTSSTLDTTNIGNVFFRLPHTGSDLRASYSTIEGNLSSGTSTLRVPASYRLGARTLTNTQVDNLAQQLVNRILTRGGPFRSVEEFVNSGLLQQAIDATDINGVGANRLDRYATSFLTQGDILQAISHRLTARSDTFTIRAYGEAGAPALDPNDANFTKGRAWLEATVQRMPLKHPTALNPGDDMTDTGDTAGTHLGREFRIVSFRWLQLSDL
jgi:hypothetical protein